MRRHTRPPSALPTLCQAHTAPTASPPSVPAAMPACGCTHTLHRTQACRMRRTGMRAAAAAAAATGAMVPPFEDMPGGEPRTSRGKRASGHSRGRPLHHARLALHRKRRHGDRTVSAPRGVYCTSHCALKTAAATDASATLVATISAATATLAFACAGTALSSRIPC